MQVVALSRLLGKQRKLSALCHALPERQRKRTKPLYRCPELHDVRDDALVCCYGGDGGRNSR